MALAKALDYNVSTGNLSCNIAGPGDTCSFHCDEPGAQQYGFDCGNVDICNIHCEQTDCLNNPAASLNASFAGLLNVYGSGAECLKDLNIFLPNNGNANFIDIGDMEKSFKKMIVNAGTNTGTIRIDCTGIAKEKCRQMVVNAQSAQYLKIDIGYSTSFQDAIINCPRNSSFKENHLIQSQIAPCILNATNSQQLRTVTINTVQGIPADVWIINGVETTYRDVTITSTSPVCSQKLSEPFDSLISLCWNTDEPTTEPTTDPTSPTEYPSIAPSISPTLTPSSPPTEYPSIAPSLSPTLIPSSPPTGYPSIAPSITPTVTPSLSPTGYPSISPSITPTLAPSLSPTEYPSISPSISPTLSPSVAPTNPTQDPTSDPTQEPTLDPTQDPTREPTYNPTQDPTLEPTYNPTLEPTYTRETVIVTTQNMESNDEGNIPLLDLLYVITFITVCCFCGTGAIACICVVAHFVTPKNNAMTNLERHFTHNMTTQQNIPKEFEINVQPRTTTGSYEEEQSDDSYESDTKSDYTGTSGDNNDTSGTDYDTGNGDTRDTTDGTGITADGPIQYKLPTNNVTKGGWME